jgi:hypothetical protein
MLRHTSRAQDLVYATLALFLRWDRCCINLNNAQDVPVLKETIKVHGPFTDSPKNPEDCFLSTYLFRTIPVGANKRRPTQGLARMCITNIEAQGSPKLNPGNNGLLSELGRKHLLGSGVGKGYEIGNLKIPSLLRL